jgi:hypothetical protein
MFTIIIGGRYKAHKSAVIRQKYFSSENNSFPFDNKSE